MEVALQLSIIASKLPDPDGSVSEPTHLQLLPYVNRIDDLERRVADALEILQGPTHIATKVVAAITILKRPR